MTFRIVAILRNPDQVVVVEEPASEEAGMTRMRDWRFSQAVWTMHGKRMYYLQLQRKLGDGEWERVTSIVDPWKR
jgi:hypothetical protein